MRVLSKTINNVIYTSDSLLAEIEQMTTGGKKEVTVYGKNVNNTPELRKYNLDVYIIEGNLLLDGDTTRTYNGITFNNNVYTVGSVEDCGTAEKYAERTVVLKVTGDITINSLYTLTSVANASGYGGPKGMIIYCGGKIINHGKISMTARGARAVGENIYLWKNANGTYEYVPAVGGAGGSGQKAGANASTVSTPRALGRWRRRTKNGRTGKQCRRKWNSSYFLFRWNRRTEVHVLPLFQEKPMDVLEEEEQVQSIKLGGGAGNPGGTSDKGTKGGNGTGGLLVMYASTIENNRNH